MQNFIYVTQAYTISAETEFLIKDAVSRLAMYDEPLHAGLPSVIFENGIPNAKPRFIVMLDSDGRVQFTNYEEA